MTRFDQPSSGWQRSLRLWSQLSRGFRSGGAILLEVEAYDTGVSEALTSAFGAWRYASIALSYRIRR